MNRKQLVILMIFLSTVWVPFTLLAQSKRTNADRIVKRLSENSQMKKEGWSFGFSEDYCTFIKTRQFLEKDNTPASRFQLNVPLGNINLELEQKNYDTFFQCGKKGGCVEEFWYDRNDKITNRQMINNTSLYIKNLDTAQEMLRKFDYQRTLCDRTHYPGPTGLLWGEPLEVVKRKLSKKFSLIDERVVKNGIIYQHQYDYEFSGFPTEKILVNFLDAKWFEMQVYLKIQDPSSISRRFREVVERIKEKYGLPNTIALPAVVANYGDFTNPELYPDIGVFDSEIREKQWVPGATWNFGNNVVISVNTVTNTNGRNLIWEFYHQDLKTEAKKRIEETPVDDF